MSYTPENEEIDEAIHAVRDTLASLRDRMMNRIASGDYKDTHVEQLAATITTITQLDIQLARLGV